jgi:MFS family permease
MPGIRSRGLRARKSLKAAASRPQEVTRLQMNLLRRHAAFRNLWFGQTISVFGDQITMIALPLVAVLTLDAGPLAVGVLAAAGWAPHLVLSLGVGEWIDRRSSKRRALVWADVLRAATLATIPLAYAVDALTLAHLFAVALTVGSLTVVFDMAYATFLPLVVPREDVVEAQGRMSVSRSASYIGGPALGGALVQALTAPVALAADALSFLGSALFVSRARVAEPEPEVAEGTLWSRLGVGLRFVFTHPLLRAGVLCTSTINFFNLAFNAILVLFMSEELGLSPGLIGVVFSAGAVGALAGALVAPAVGRRLGIGPAVVAGAVLFPLPLVAFPLAGGPEWAVVATLIAAEALSSIGVMLYDVNLNSLNLLATPWRLRGRQSGAARLPNYGVRPLGALAGGLLAEAIGLRGALLIGALGALGGVLWLLASPMPRTREIAEAEAEAAVA